MEAESLDVTSMKKDELRAHLEKRGLDLKGGVQALRKRLNDAIRSGAPAEVPGDPSRIFRLGGDAARAELRMKGQSDKGRLQELQRLLHCWRDLHVLLEQEVAEPMHAAAEFLAATHATGGVGTCSAPPCWRPNRPRP